jgi:uncharacterized protein (TIGR02246 family)
MQNRAPLLSGLVALSFLTIACSKKDATVATVDSTDSIATVAPADRSADATAIIALDSGWMRNVMAKNVDSLMTYYAPDAVSYGFGSAVASGTDQLRASYTEMVKSTMTNPTITPGAVEFSDDGTMAYDHGTYSMTVTPPGGKTSSQSGAYLNVWKKINGQWKLIAEMSTPVPPAKP